ncbi:DNA-processing protein DprA [Desemzia sp. RIT804]|uniref:DNA-processing protein DprA n=1 Tax=Desemzia sp. RIT 804 TaxID=2810209 RepID=UPI00194EA117|nr:DNA-processing protein DprA [Desemzia sp. RIT 804]MBM6613760.1 DNA-processing protein DprA [Desemzia sp. RIT 804]
MLDIKQLNLIMLHLTLCKGIDSSQRIMMIVAVMENPDCTLVELAESAGLREKNKAIFYESYRSISLAEVVQDYQKYNIHWVSILDPQFPEYLRHIYDPPALLFYKGNIGLAKENLLSVVGSRVHSPYTTEVLRQFIPVLVEKKLVLVSGLAKGVDTQTHQLTLQKSGKTIAVIGCGLDYYYPKENQMLQDEIAKNHLLLSEYPMGTKPLKHHFPMRNRIIAGLSMGTLVIEAKYRSGSLITANLALREGREVFAVPGDITNPFCAGTNDLIVQGATCVLNGEMLAQNYLL